MPIRRVWPETVYQKILPPNTKPPYAQVVEVTRPAGGTSIHVAGTFPGDLDWNLVGGSDMGAQVAAALENIRHSLTAVGAQVSDVVRIKFYVTDLPALIASTPEVDKFFGENVPTSTAVQVSGLAMPGAMVEIEAYAELT
jgi:enamine deaminase RidA (YjgF/YER057c/UK114 family)